MSLTANHAMIVYGAVALICVQGPMPLVIFYTNGTRTDGVAVLTEDAIQFTPFTPDYTGINPPIRLTATYWGPPGQPEKIEVLIPNQQILQTYQQHFQASPQHLEHVQSEHTMQLANEALTAFIACAVATFTDPSHPPTWEALHARWKAEGHDSILRLQDRIAADEQKLANFHAAIAPALQELQQNAASTQQIAELRAAMQAHEAMVMQQLKAVQDTVATALATRPTVIHDAPAAPDQSGPIGELAKAILDARAPTEATDLTADVRQWGPLFARYGSWEAVRDHLYRTLHVTPNARKPPMLEVAFSSFDDLFNMVFARWETVESLCAPGNVDVVECLNNSLRRLVLAAKYEEGLCLKSDVARMTAAASASALSLQRSMEATYRTTFVPTKKSRPPERNMYRFSHGNSKSQGNGRGGRAGDEAAQSTDQPHIFLTLLNERVPKIRHPPAAIDVGAVEHDVTAFVSSMWSNSTWMQMRSLWARLNLFCDEYELPRNEKSCILFLHSLSVSGSTKHTYTRYLINIFRKMGWAHSQLSLYDSALRSTGASFPTQQTLPMTPDDLTSITEGLPPSTTAPLKLAWKTASRWNEVARLTSESVLSCTPDEIVIYFGSETKTSRQHPFRPDLFVVIQGRWTDEIAVYLQSRTRIAAKGTPLFPISTETITDILRPFGFSAHSLKRGAIEYLFRTLEVGDPRMQLIPLLAKHGATFGPLRELTIRYVTDQANMARHLGTGLLTSLL